MCIGGKNFFIIKYSMKIRLLHLRNFLSPIRDVRRAIWRLHKEDWFCAHKTTKQLFPIRHQDIQMKQPKIELFGLFQRYLDMGLEDR